MTQEKEKIKWYEWLNPFLWISLIVIFPFYLIFQTQYTLQKLYENGTLDLK